MMKILPIEVEETSKQGRMEDHLKSAQVKMDEVREENKRLKHTISQMMKDYHSLKMHFHDLVQENQPQRSTDSAPTAASDDESELVSLRLGRFSGDAKSEKEKSSHDQSQRQNNKKQLGGLELGLDFKFPSANQSPEYGLDGSKEEQSNAFCKNTKTVRRGDDEILEVNPLKKPRVSVRAVCDTETMNDGCQWRKYGQKIAKGNPCPRAYYRCTIGSSCPVRKQVQRCAENMSILTTTYEGTHNHPLPASATSMASATLAAAAMLKCGSSASSPPAHGVPAASSTSPSPLRFDFPSSNSLAPPCFPRASISTIQSHPTVTLDLTTPNQTPSSYNRSSSSCFSTRSSSSSTTCFNFSTSSRKKTHEAIACDNLTFESALAAAITSFAGNGGIDIIDQERSNSGWSKNINFSEPSMAVETNGCYRMNSQQRNLASFPPFSVSTSRNSTVFLPADGEM